MADSGGLPQVTQVSSPAYSSLPVEEPGAGSEPSPPPPGLVSWWARQVPWEVGYGSLVRGFSEFSTFLSSEKALLSLNISWFFFLPSLVLMENLYHWWWKSNRI